MQNVVDKVLSIVPSLNVKQKHVLIYILRNIDINLFDDDRKRKLLAIRIADKLLDYTTELAKPQQTKQTKQQQQQQQQESEGRSQSQQSGQQSSRSEQQSKLMAKLIAETEHVVEQNYIDKPIFDKLRRAYLYLDSRNRILTTENWSKFSWYYTIDRTINQGVITNVLGFSNIIAMKLLQPILPKASNLITTNQRISILIEEFAYYAHNRKYHWLCRYTDEYKLHDGFDPNPPLRKINVNVSDGIFKFPEPVNFNGTLTLTFGNPTDLVVFNRDRDVGTVSAYGATTTITVVNPHNLLDGDLVKISGFTTGTLSYDNNSINTLDGLYVTVTSGNTFTIPVDTSSGAVSWILNQPVNVFYDVFRVTAGLEFIYYSE